MSISPNNQKLLNRYKYFLDNNVEENKKRNNTRKAYYRDLIQFLEYLDNKAAEEANYDDAMDWLKTLTGMDGGKTSVATRNRKKASIRAFYNYLRSMHIIENDPFILLTPETIVRGEEGNQAITDILDQYEINRFKKALENEVKNPTHKKGAIKKYVKMNALRWRALFNLILESGMRVGEVYSLERYQVQIDEQKGCYIYIPPSKNKNPKKSRTIPIPAYVRDYIKEYRDSIPFELDNDYVFVSQTGNPLDRGMIDDKLKEYTKLAKIDKELTPHSLRHTFASHKLNVEHIPSTVVVGWMGHSSSKMLEEIYYHQEEMHGECAI